mmetsp:Transcript_479/g.1146  ORF Transcript_479/g.1146 Transcript_479/m.1146 type:complete len:230 (-) Transcript_479:196-885(-)
MVKEAWIPPYDEWAKEAELTFWFGRWRDPKSQLGFEFLYKDGKPRPQYPRRDDWSEQEYPVDFDSSWAQGRKAWEVWLAAFDAWDHERKRLCEVYLRLGEDKDAAEASELARGKFPKAPRMPESVVALYQAAHDGDVVALADLLEDEEIDICCKDHNLQTPLMFAAVSGSLECVEYLVDMGADIAAADNTEETALDLALAQHGEKSPKHPVILYLHSVKAPRGPGKKSR